MTSLALLEPPAEVADDLETCAALVAGRLNRAHADLVALAARLLDGDRWAGGGVLSAEHWLVLRLGLSPARARDVVRLARRSAELPVTWQAVQDGALSLDQAVVVARHVPAHHDRAAAELAVHATVPQLRRALSRYRFSEPPVESERVEQGVEHGDEVTEPADEAADETAEEPVGDASADASPDASTDPTEDHSDDASVDPTDRPVNAERPMPDAEGPTVVGSAAWAAAEPSLSMHHADGRFFLRYDAPSDVGALVEQALLEAKDALFRLATGQTSGDSDADADGSVADADRPGWGHEGSAADRRGWTGPSTRVTMADALAELARRSLGECTPRSRQDHYRVYVHLDADGAWVNGRGAIPPSLAARFACDGTAQAIHERDGVPVSVGRALRIVPDRTRRLVEDRDRGCRYPGCLTTRHLEVHHLDHWADGGRTDLDRLVCLCPRHHDAHHRGDFTMTGDPTTWLGAHGASGGLRFRDVHGHLLGLVAPHRDAPDRVGAPYAGPSGDVLHLRLVELPSNAELARADAWREKVARTGSGDEHGAAGESPWHEQMAAPTRMTSVLDLIADDRWQTAQFTPDPRKPSDPSDPSDPND